MPPKVGIGFFINANEFNYDRTVTLLQATPAAIYMPRATLVQVEPDALVMTVTERVAVRSKLYRPIEQFVTDMKAFTQTGALPHYSCES